MVPLSHKKRDTTYLRFSFFKKTFSFLFRKTRKKDRFRFYLDRQEKKWPELKTLSKN